MDGLQSVVTQVDVHQVEEAGEGSRVDVGDIVVGHVDLLQVEQLDFLIVLTVHQIKFALLLVRSFVYHLLPYFLLMKINPSTSSISLEL